MNALVVATKSGEARGTLIPAPRLALLERKGGRPLLLAGRRVNGGMLMSRWMADPDQLRKALVAFAMRAAQTTESALIDVLKRPKSQAYLLGRMQRRFPEANPEALREFIDRTRWELADDPEAHEVVEKVRRPPSVGREPVSSAMWDVRIEALLDLLDEPLITEELYSAADAAYDWSPNFFTAVISAADGREAVRYLHPLWARMPRRCWDLPNPNADEHWAPRGVPYMEALEDGAKGHEKALAALRRLRGQPPNDRPGWLAMRAAIVFQAPNATFARFVSGKGTCYRGRFSGDEGEFLLGRACRRWLERGGILEDLPPSESRTAHRVPDGVPAQEVGSVEQLLEMEGMTNPFRLGAEQPPLPPPTKVEAEPSPSSDLAGLEVAHRSVQQARAALEARRAELQRGIEERLCGEKSLLDEALEAREAALNSCFRGKETGE